MSAFRIFISYRQAEAKDISHSIAEQLKARYGNKNVFVDWNIRSGDNWQHEINSQLQNCTILLVVIRKEWAKHSDENGVCRIHNVDDPVRYEIARAIKLGIKIIPLLIDHATLPGQEDLPQDLWQLLQHQSTNLRSGKFLEADMRLLFDDLDWIHKSSSPVTAHVSTSFLLIALGASLLFVVSQHMWLLKLAGTVDTLKSELIQVSEKLDGFESTKDSIEIMIPSETPDLQFESSRSHLQTTTKQLYKNTLYLTDAIEHMRRGIDVDNADTSPTADKMRKRAASARAAMEKMSSEYFFLGTNAKAN